MEDTQAQPSAGTTQQYVSIPEASDEDLQSFLEKGDEAEGVEKSAEPATTEQTSKPEAQQEAQQEPPAAEDEESIKLSKADLNKLQKRLEQQELYIKHRSNEIGELKKRLREATDKLKVGLEEKAVESPKDAMQAAVAVHENEQKIQQLEQEEQRLNYSQQANEIITRYVKPEEMDLDGMTAALEADGLPPEYIQNFRTNPVMNALPETIIHLAKRAKAERAARVLASAYKKLQEENKQLKGKPQAVVDKLEAALSSNPTVTASTGGGTGQRSVPANPAHMSDAEIAEFLKNAK